MFGFGKNKQNAAKDLGDKYIYIPEEDFGEDQKVSNWRHPIDPNRYYFKAKRQYLELSSKIQTVFFWINIALAMLVFIGVLYLILGVNYETTVIYDGTNLYCMIDETGVVKPWQPPQ
ncbi:hypothetical protein ACFBZI_11235 [Moraxella sp. ZJ142]|uniref:hypothetical protein n=1 Tax=Moraxella marmotae TaxID=3344520 RepID=UPI0035D44EBE